MKGTYNGYEEPHVRLCERTTHEVVFTIKDLLKTVKRSEQFGDRLLICLLSCCEASSVYAI